MRKQRKPSFAFRNLAISFAILILVIIGGWFGARYWLYSFLKSDKSVAWLNNTTSSAIGGTAHFSQLQPQSLDAIYIDEVTLGTTSPSLSLKAEQLRADVRFSFLSRSCVVERIDITRLNLSIASPGLPASSSSPSLQDTASSNEKRFELRHITSGNFNFQWPEGSLQQSNLSVQADSSKANGWLLNGTDGTVRLNSPGLDTLSWRVSDYKARVENGAFHLVDATLRHGPESKLTVEGSVLEHKGSRWGITYTLLPVEAVTDGDWRARLHGKISGRLQIEDDGNGTPVRRKGSFELHNGEVSALPFLDALAQLTMLERFRRLPLHQGSAKYSGSDKEGYEVSEIVMESTGLVRVEGRMTLHGAHVEGEFMLGLPPGIAQRFPGGRTLFASERQGYLWTPVKLSGPLASPTEDLSPRLLQAATGEVVEQTGSAIRQGVEGARKTTKGVLDSVAPLLPVNPAKLLE